jgi:hypothetical protein
VVRQGPRLIRHDHFGPESRTAIDAWWPAVCSTRGMSLEQGGLPASKQDSLSPVIHIDADLDGSVRVVEKRDRRSQQRLPTPPCPRCLWADAVTVATRWSNALHWTCARCAWSWLQSLPTSPQRS